VVISQFETPLHKQSEIGNPISSPTSAKDQMIGNTLHFGKDESQAHGYSDQTQKEIGSSRRDSKNLEEIMLRNIMEYENKKSESFNRGGCNDEAKIMEDSQSEEYSQGRGLNPAIDDSSQSEAYDEVNMADDSPSNRSIKVVPIKDHSFDK